MMGICSYIPVVRTDIHWREDIYVDLQLIDSIIILDIILIFYLSYHLMHSNYYVLRILGQVNQGLSIVYPIYRTTSPITARQPQVHQISLSPPLSLSLFFSRSEAVMRNLFKSKSPSNRTSHHSMRSAEQLARPAFAPPDPNITDSDRRFSQYEYSGPVQNQPQTLNRSQSQRQKPLRDRPTVNVVAPDDSHRKTGRVERSVSVKGKPISLPISQPTSPGILHPGTLDESDEFQPHLRHSYAENPSPVAPQSLAYQQQYQAQRAPRPSHPAHAQDNPEWSQQPVQPLYTKLQRSNTDPTLLEQYVRPSPTDIVPESPRYASEHHHRGQAFPPAQDPVLNTRPPSQQTHEPLSPLQSLYPDAMQSSAQVSQNQGQFHQLDRQKSAGSPQQNRSRQGSVSNNMPDPGRSTPTNTHRREDSGEVDVRALIQKHDELRKVFDSGFAFLIN